jgi:hypothetical protein
MPRNPQTSSGTITRMAGIRRANAAAATIAVACAALSGCTVTVGHPNQSATPKLSKEDLQKDISQRVAGAGQAPQAVTCPDDLVGQLGQSTRCDVTMSATSSFEAIVTVTGLEGANVNYDIAPSVSKSQLEGSVSQFVTNSTKARPDSVSCQSGLDGKVGAVAYCDVTAHGATTRRTVEVSQVSGLQMRYGLISVLAKPVVESSLLFQLKQTGQQPDSAACAGDLEGMLGNTVECTTVTAGQTQRYILTVTAVSGDNITYKYDRQP